jgi:hypothetical protein
VNRDYFGREIKAGDYLVRGTREGNTGAVRVCRVLSVEKAVKVIDVYGTIGTLQVPGRTVIVTPTSLPHGVVERVETLVKGGVPCR